MSKNNNKQYVVLGLGVFGSTVATTLSDYGNEVLAIDKSIDCVNRVGDRVMEAAQADITDINQLRELGVADFDIGIVAVGSHLEDSVMAVLNLKELGIPYIVAKAKNKRYATILEKVGANRIVRPEKEIGERVAKSLLRKNIKDLIEIDEENSIVDFNIPASWVGKTIQELDLRNCYGINILGIRHHGVEKLNLAVNPDYVVEDSDQFLIIAATKVLEKYDYTEKF